VEWRGEIRASCGCRHGDPFHAGPRLGGGAIADDAIADLATRALAARVSVWEEPGYTARQPAERVWTLALRLADGTRREATVIGTPGDPDRPLPEAALRENFRRSVEPGFGPRWATLREMARGMDALPRVATLLAACRG
jgi:2-methylcitrate dehydratase PrpD